MELLSSWDDFPLTNASPVAVAVRRRLRKVAIAYANEVVKRETGRDLLQARCLAHADVAVIVNWVFVDVLGIDGVQTRETAQDIPPGSPFAALESPDPDDLPVLLANFDRGTALRLEGVDQRRDEAGGGATQWEVACFAAWVHGEVLRIRPFCEGNLFAAYTATWWAVRLCGFMIPISHPRNDEYLTASRYEQYDAAITDSLQGPYDDAVDELDVQPRDQLMAGFLAAQIGKSRGFRRFAPGR